MRAFKFINISISRQWNFDRLQLLGEPLALNAMSCLNMSPPHPAGTQSGLQGLQSTLSAMQSYDVPTQWHDHGADIPGLGYLGKAMNEKFKKNEVWGYLGKANQRYKRGGTQENRTSSQDSGATFLAWATIMSPGLHITMVQQFYQSRS